MEQVCQVCGRRQEVSPWQGEYQSHKPSQSTSVYICAACQDRIQQEAKSRP